MHGHRGAVGGLLLLAGLAPALGQTVVMVPGVAAAKPALRCASLAPALAVTNTTAETAYVFDKPCVIPAEMLTPGTAVRVTQIGVYRAGLAQSIQPRIRLGPVSLTLTGRPVLATTAGAVTGLLNAATDTPWSAETLHVVQADGSVQSGGRLVFATSLTSAVTVLVADTAPVSGVDRSIDNTLTASAQWGSALSANQIRATLMMVEVFKP